MKEHVLTHEERIHLKRGRGMKVFISWSGGKSKEVAALLARWLRWVLQALRPWMSEDNIESGAMWFQRICEELKETANSIIVVTQENKDNPWIMFEAGAASKGDSSNKVIVFAVDLRPEDIPQPLGHFNCVVPTREKMHKLVFDINKRIDEINGECMTTVYDDQLEIIFDKWYPDFEKEFNKILEKYADVDLGDTRSPEERKQDEILASVREIERAIVETKKLTELNTITNMSPETRKLMLTLLEFVYNQKKETEE